MDSDSDPLAQTFLNDDYLVSEDQFLSDDSSNDNIKCNTLLREQDRFLPIANIAKIMKRAIPENGKIAKDARECIQECVSEFISFITSEASERCHKEKRKTINGEDILYSMVTLGFDNYVQPLTVYLHKYRETIKSDRNLLTKDDSSDAKSEIHSPRNGGNTSAPAGTVIDGATLYYQPDQNHQPFHLA